MAVEVEAVSNRRGGRGMSTMTGTRASASAEWARYREQTLCSKTYYGQDSGPMICEIEFPVQARGKECSGTFFDPRTR